MLNLFIKFQLVIPFSRYSGVSLPVKRFKIIDIPMKRSRPLFTTEQQSAGMETRFSKHEKFNEGRRNALGPSRSSNLPKPLKMENTMKKRGSSRKILEYEEPKKNFKIDRSYSSAIPVSLSSEMEREKNDKNQTENLTNENQMSIQISNQNLSSRSDFDSSSEKSNVTNFHIIQKIESLTPCNQNQNESNRQIKKESKSPKKKSLEIHSSNSNSEFSQNRNRNQNQNKFPLAHSLLILKCSDWYELNVRKGELDLDLTLPTGQTFRWRKTGEKEFTGVVGKNIIEMKEEKDAAIHYRFYHEHNAVVDEKKVEKEIENYFNLNISLLELWDSFSKQDDYFASMAEFLYGARILRQDPLECLFQFICSSNNNITRITSMVHHLCSYGEYLGEVNGHKFHSFPNLLQLSKVSEEELRVNGFGYRSKYLTRTISTLLSKEEGGEAWLHHLCFLPFPEAMALLSSELAGVGPKVAACVSLFSLHKNNSIPMDTHVQKLVTRHYSSIWNSKNVNLKTHLQLSITFQTIFGEMCGWALNALFIAELLSVKSRFPTNNQTVVKAIEEK